MVLLVLGACRKDDLAEEPTPATYHISESLHPFMFQSNSYWVYENDSTGVLDSVSVVSAYQGYFNQPPQTPGSAGPLDKIEYHRINLFSHLNSTSYNDFLFSSMITRNGNETPHFGQPIFLAQQPVGSERYGAYVWDQHDSLYVEGNLFTDVTEMKIVHEEQHEPAFSNDTYLFFVDSIGLVKKVTDLGDGDIDSWSLERWNVVL
jgi:hypothetical protein